MDTALRTNASIENTLQKYADTVYRIAFARVGNAYDAEDIMQEVFLRFIRRKPSFENEEHEKAWFIKVTVNCSKSLLSSPWRRRVKSTDEPFPSLDTEKSETWYAVSTLSEKRRVIIHLFYYEDMSVADISKAMGISLSSVKTELHRARQQLKAILTDEEF